MKELPLTLRPSPLKQLLERGEARIRRPSDGMYKGLKAEDRLWLREGYFLPKRWNSFAPTDAESCESGPTFLADLDGKHPRELGLGVSRPSYTLPRFWSRYHLTVCAVEMQKLDAITLEEAQAEGFSSREAWFAEWDDLVGSVNGRTNSRRSAANPTVLVIDAQLVRQPLDVRPKELA